MVSEVLKPFVEEICEDEHTVIKVVLFDHYTEQIDIPCNRQAAGRLIEQRVRAQGGTDFHAASQGLVAAASQMLQEYPTFQVLSAFSSAFSFRNHLQWFLLFLVCWWFRASRLGFW